MSQQQFWKLLTSDFRAPLQGGEPLFDGKTFPYVLPKVELDTTDDECSYGWNFVRDIETGFAIAGLWRTGRPNAVLLVEPSADGVERGQKCRCSQLTLVRHATDDEIQQALSRFSKCFGAHQQAMADEQWAWWRALKRPYRDEEKVVAGLTVALAARGLDWKIKRFETARDARDARDAWAAWAAWDARDARDAWAALTVSFSARSGWITHAHDKLTVGIRDAYLNGLAIALPTGPNELGYAMGGA